MKRTKAVCVLKNARVAVLTTLKKKDGSFDTKVSTVRPYKSKKRDEVKFVKTEAEYEKTYKHA